MSNVQALLMLLYEKVHSWKNNIPNGNCCKGMGSDNWSWMQSSPQQSSLVERVDPSWSLPITASIL